MQIITYADNQQCWVFQYGTTTKKSFNCLNSFEYIFKKLHKTPLQGHHCVYTGKENKSHAWHLTAVDEVALTLGMLLHMLQTHAADLQEGHLYFLKCQVHFALLCNL